MRTQKVWTPNGYTQGPINSLVGKGESIIDYTNGTGTLVTKGKKGGDNQPSSVEQNDNNVIMMQIGATVLNFQTKLLH